jgi:hypothetical protein
MTELISANPKKPRHLVGQWMTFVTLVPGEVIKLPGTWFRAGLQGIGAPQGLGACTPDTTLSLDQAMTNLVNVLSAGTLQCSSASPYPYVPSQEVCDFQSAYQTAATAAGSTLTPMPLNTVGTAVDGELGPATITAINAYLTSISASYSLACSGDVLTQVAAGSVTPPPVVVPPVVKPPVVVPPVVVPGSTSSTTTSSTMTTVLYGGVALLVAGGAFWWLRKHQSPHAGGSPAGRPMLTHGVRRTRAAARRRHR